MFPYLKKNLLQIWKYVFWNLKYYNSFCAMHCPWMDVTTIKYFQNIFCVSSNYGNERNKGQHSQSLRCFQNEWWLCLLLEKNMCLSLADADFHFPNNLVLSFNSKFPEGEKNHWTEVFALFSLQESSKTDAASLRNETMVWKWFLSVGGNESAAPTKRFQVAENRAATCLSKEKILY